MLEVKFVCFPVAATDRPPVYLFTSLELVLGAFILLSLWVVLGNFLGNVFADKRCTGLNSHIGHGIQSGGNIFELKYIELQFPSNFD